MAYPLPTAAISVSGEAVPTYLTGSLASSYSTGQTFTLSTTTTWLEVGTNGQITANPLGTSGLFVVVVDFGLSTEEHILCSSLNTSTGVVTVWTDGTYNGRGWDGTTISAHSAGSSSNLNCFPIVGGTYFAGLSSVISTLSTTYAPLLSPSVTASAASAVGLTVRGAVSQTGDYFDVKNSAGTILYSINSAGAVNFNGFTINTNVLTGLSSVTATGNQTIIQPGTNLATVTNVATASPSAGSLTFTANNNFVVGQIVTTSGITPSQFNISLLTVTAVSSTGFSVASNATGTYVSGGTATAWANDYALTVKKATGGISFQAGNTSNIINVNDTINSSGSMTLVGAGFGGSLAVQGYGQAYPTINSQLRGNSGLFSDSYVSTLYSNANYRLFRVDGWGRLASLGDNRPATVIPVAPSNITSVSGNGTTITVNTNNHSFSAGQYVVISGITTTTAYNGTYQITAVSTGQIFTVSGTATGTATFGTASVAVSAVSAGNPATNYVTYTTSTNHGLWIGATVTVAGITGATAYNNSNAVVLSIPSPTTFVLYNTATGGSPVFTSATVSYNTALATPSNSAGNTTNPSDTFQVVDIYQNPRFGISNTSTALNSPVWAVNAYSGKIINVANGSATGDAVNYGQLSTFAGATSIATVGTVTSGTWNATPISNTYLANSSVTIGTTSISLGTTATGISSLVAPSASLYAPSISVPNFYVNPGGYPSAITWYTFGTTIAQYLVPVGSATGTLTLPNGTDTLAGISLSQTLTNKTISGSSNTLSNIAPSSLTASAVTVGSTSIGLGATATTVAGLTLTSPTANNAIISTTASGSIPLVIRGVVAQTADLEEWQNSASTVLAKIDAGGNLVAQSITPSGIGTATASTRYVGGTNNGYPTVGTFTVGDFIVDHSATIWVCSSGSVTYALTAAVSGSSTITYTTSATSVPKVGDYITVTGFSPTAFNVTGLAVISSNFGAKQFSVGASASGLTATGTGTGITNGYWSPTESQSVTTRSSGSATAQLGELTLFSPSATANLTLTMPANPVAGSQYSVINNNATYSVKLSGALSLQGVTTTLYSVDPGEAYGFVYDGTNYWYNTWTTDITNLVGILPTTNGGTGLNGFTAANNALYSTSASVLTAGTLPIVAGGTGATSASGVLTNIGASPATGSSSISTVGTITSGVWQGTAISNTYIANPSVTVGSTTISLGSTATAITGLTLSGTANTFSGIPASALSASAVTIGTTTIGLGATSTTVNGLTIAGATATNPAGSYPGFIVFSSGPTGFTQITGTTATGNNYLTLPNISGSDTLVSTSATQILTNKTLTSPVETNSTISTSSTTTVPLSVTGVSSQTADYLDIKNSAGTILFSISSAGTVSATNYIQGAQGITLNTSSTGSSSDAVTLTDRSSTATPKSVSLRAKSASSGGGLEAINDAFSQSIMSLTNTGAFSTIGGTIFWAINSVTASAYTTVLSDGGALITLSAASATTVTIPPASSVAYPVGTQLNIVGTAASANTVTIQGGSGVTVQSTGATSSAPKLRTQYSSASVIQYATNTWLVVGDIA